MKERRRREEENNNNGISYHLYRGSITADIIIWRILISIIIISYRGGENMAENEAGGKEKKRRKEK